MELKEKKEALKQTHKNLLDALLWTKHQTYVYADNALKDFNTAYNVDFRFIKHISVLGTHYSIE